MINNCKDCETSCCRFGPGPFEIVPVQKFLKRYCEPKSYNTQCKSLQPNGLCSLWNTTKLPFECRTWICNIRMYNKKELKKISAMIYE